MIIFNSPELLQTLFVNRGSIYSGRNIFFIVKNYLFPGQEYPLSFQNDVKLRRMRTALKHVTGPSGLAEALPMQDRIAAKLVSHLRQRAYSPEKCLGMWSFEIALTAVMGPVASEEGLPELMDRWSVLQHELLDVLASGGSSAYDMMPLLAHLPRVVPGAAEAKTRAVRVGKGLNELYGGFIARLKQHLLRQETGSGKKIEYLGLVGKIMESQRMRPASKGRASEGEVDSYTESQLIPMTQAVQDAATDTTTSTIMTCILALSTHPEILRKAQDEVDRVCEEGDQDMPSPSDIGSLPYVRACIWEVGFFFSPSLSLGDFENEMHR